MTFRYQRHSVAADNEYSGKMRSICL